ncbi:MAG: hypothetical protein O2955_13790 [Planctomycetota bacterium]|nr:hypothetical protein [Planctomycetota bacterium]MDA1213582.1 hypothetical protein [Planctomycetota bacterium]
MNTNKNFDSKTVSDHVLIDDLDAAIRESASDSRINFSKAQVASLNSADIAHMDCTELIAAIKSTELPLLTDEQLARLTFQDRDTLERLLYLARKCVRNQGY